MQCRFFRWPFIQESNGQLYYYYRTHFSGSADVQYAIKRYKKISKRYFRTYSYLGHYSFLVYLFIFSLKKKRNLNDYKCVTSVLLRQCVHIYIRDIFFWHVYLLLYVFRGYARIGIRIRIQFFNVFFLMEDLFCVECHLLCTARNTHSTLCHFEKI
jgi:hypothetical protein